jgi:23S rRNA pseudouridine1911/1915/1917 synthase
MIKAGPIAFTEPKIIFEDQHLIVLSKPAGLLSQGEHRGDPNLVDWLRNYLARPYVGLIHRLDRNTSGIMIVAKRTKSAQRLTSSLQEGKLFRSYLGWVIGKLSDPVRWSHSLQKNETTNTVKVILSGGKASSLIATPKEYGKWNQIHLTLVEFRLETGRSHQIRVQAAFEGFPLLGDKKYGTGTRDLTFSRVALHSFCLEFPHPMSGEILHFEDPLPSDLQEPIKRTLSSL